MNTPIYHNHRFGKSRTTKALLPVTGVELVE